VKPVNVIKHVFGLFGLNTLWLPSCARINRGFHCCSYNSRHCASLFVIVRHCFTTVFVHYFSARFILCMVHDARAAERVFRASMHSCAGNQGSLLDSSMCASNRGRIYLYNLYRWNPLRAIKSYFSTTRLLHVTSNSYFRWIIILPSHLIIHTAGCSHHRRVQTTPSHLHFCCCAA